MPLFEQLKELSEPGNPQGVCTVASAVTAHILMNGPDSISGLSTLKLPLKTYDTPPEIDLTSIKQGGGFASELDVTKLEKGEAKVWKYKGESALEGGGAMIEWLKSNEAKPGVYVCCVDQPDDDDEHFFNIAKTDKGQVYMIDSSMQNFVELKGLDDLSVPVIGVREMSGSEDESLSKEEDLVTVESPVEKEDMVPFSQIYCAGRMKLDFCGPLDSECARELKQSFKRSVREDYSPSERPSGTSQKVMINK